MNKNFFILVFAFFPGCSHREPSQIEKEGDRVSFNSPTEGDNGQEENSMIKSVTEMPDSAGCLQVFRANSSGDVGWRFERSDISYSTLAKLKSLVDQLVRSKKLTTIVYVVEMQGGPEPEIIDQISTSAAKARADVLQLKIVYSNTSIPIDVDQ